MRFEPIPEALLKPCAEPGTMRRFTYMTETFDDTHAPVEKPALVYLPYGYNDDASRRYPVLYLMHGGGGDENEWFGGVEATSDLKLLLDNMMMTGAAPKMIVVAPTYTMPGWEEARHTIGIAVKLTHRFQHELKQSLLPAIDAAFRTIAEPRARAFGGFSMGGETTWSVMSGCVREIRTYMPLSGDYWIKGLKAAKDFPEETADALIDQLRTLGVTKDDYRVLAFTGDKDIAYEALDPMIHALAKRPDWFTYADTPDGGNLTYCLKKNGWHTYESCYEYVRLAMPWLFHDL